MKHERFERWLQNIYETQDVEISCTQCFDLISGFVEAEISSQKVAAQLLHVKQHLDQCRACREEYEVLRDLILIENQGNAPRLDDLRASIP
ncbi:MAG TPA: hypothetical protein VFG81_20370 [Anaerolineales bacterium]|jgi:hypothetical protein|nr:hypothetical protein [Anaerolineales bacterium]